MLNPRPKPPMPGGEHVQVIDSGPQPVPPGIKTVKLIAVGDGGPGPLLPRVTRRPKRKPVLPTPDEIATLPRGAQAALAMRCAERVQPLVQLDTGAADIVGATAVALLRAAPDPRDLAFIRRDFNRLKRLSKENCWTDETSVPQDVFGPMWPEGRTPKWAREANEPRE